MVEDIAILMEVAEAITMVDIMVENIRAAIRMEKEMENLENQVTTNKKIQHLFGEVTDLIREVQGREIVKVLLTLGKGRLVLIVVIMLVISRHFLFFVL